MKRFIVVLLLALFAAACSSTPEDTVYDPGPVGVEPVPGCEHATDPEQCRLEHRKNGSDVPTVDNVKPRGY